MAVVVGTNDIKGMQQMSAGAVLFDQEMHHHGLPVFHFGVTGLIRHTLGVQVEDMGGGADGLGADGFGQFRKVSRAVPLSHPHGKFVHDPYGGNLKELREFGYLHDPQGRWVHGLG